MRTSRSLLLASVLFLPCLTSAAAQDVGGVWYFAGTPETINFGLDPSATYLSLNYDYYGLIGEGTLSRVGFDSFAGTVFQGNGLCTAELYTTISFYSYAQAVSRVRGSNGMCGFSPDYRLDVEFDR